MPPGLPEEGLESSATRTFLIVRVIESPRRLAREAGRHPERSRWTCGAGKGTRHFRDVNFLDRQRHASSTPWLKGNWIREAREVYTRLAGRHQKVTRRAA